MFFDDFTEVISQRFKKKTQRFAAIYYSKKLCEFLYPLCALRVITKQMKLFCHQ